MRKRLSSLLMALAVLAGLMVPAVPVYGDTATEFLYPSADYAVAMNSTGGDHWQLVSDGNDGTHVKGLYGVGTVTSDNYSINDTAIGHGTVTNITMSVRISNNGTINYWVVWDGIVYPVGHWSTSSSGWLTSTISLFGGEINLNSTNATWDLINSMRVGVQTAGSTSINNIGRISEIYITVTYVPGNSPSVVSVGNTLAGSGNMTLSGRVDALGDSNITSRGFAVTTNPSAFVTTPNYTQNGNWGIGSFSLNATGLTTGVTYYWAAAANDGTGWYYGAENSFIYHPSPTLTTLTTLGTSGTVIAMVANLADTGGNNITMRGFRLSTTAGYGGTVYTTTNTSPGYSAGTFSYQTSGLTIGTTYYVTAFVWGGGIGFTYGNEVSFVCGAAAGSSTVTSAVPVLTTNAVSGTGIAATQAVFSAIVTASDSPVTIRGFQWWVYGATAANNNTAMDLPGSYGTGQWGQLVQGLPPGATIYVQAFARNGAGFGYASNTINFTTLSGLPTVSIVGGSINSTIVTLYGSVDSLQGGLLTTAGFSYGLATGNYTNSGYVSATTTGAYQVVLGSNASLSPNTIYFFKAWAQGSGGLGWSTNEGQFTTGATVNVSTDAPTVVTLDPTVITTNSFKANGNLTDVGGGYVTIIGFQWSINGASWTQDGINSSNKTIPSPANMAFSVGTFAVNFTASPGVTGMYYRSFATATNSPTVYGGVKRAIFSTIPGTPGTSSTLPIVPGDNPYNDFTLILKRQMGNWGMDNTMGHWAFMGVIMLVISIPGIFGALYVYIAKSDKFMANSIGIITMILDIVVLGTFLFSGLLGMWAVFALIFAVVGLIIMFVAPLLNGGRSAAGG